MNESAVSARQVVVAVGAFGLLLVVGTIGFMLIVDESAFDALYRTVITVYTAGLVTPPATVTAKAFTLVLVVWGVAIFFYVFGLVIELVLSGAAGGAWYRRATRRRVDRLEDHYVICGFGRVGRRVAAELRLSGTPYVIVDYSPDAVAAAREGGDLLVEGSGTDDERLRAAGIERARGLVASADSDVDNLYITLSARAAREDLLIVARASTADAARKLMLAGANRVVQPYAIAGQEMAKLVLKPQVAAFLEMVTSHGGPELSFEEVEVTAESGRVGTTLGLLRVADVSGAIVVAIRRVDGSFVATPAGDAGLGEGDVLIAMGTSEELRALEELFAPQEARVG